MNGTNGREEIAAFLREQFEVVVEGTGPGAGAVTAVGCVHHGHASETAIHMFAAKLNQPAWAKPDTMAEQLDAMMIRYARGIVGGGAQQFSLVILRGDGTRPATSLPCLRVGAPNIVGPTGSLATEPPTGTGLVQLTQRWGELAIQQAGSKDEKITSLMATLLTASWARGSAVEKQLDDTRQEFMKLTVEYHKIAQQSALRSLLVRGAEKILPILPAYAGALTGAKVDPKVAEDSFFDSMVVNYGAEQLKVYVEGLKQPAKAIAAKMLVDAQRRKEAREAESRRAALADPEAELLDDAYRAIAGEQRTANGADANGKAESPPKVEVPEVTKMSNGTPSEGDKARVLDALLGQVTTEHLALLEPMLGPDLTAQVRAIKEQQEPRP